MASHLNSKKLLEPTKLRIKEQKKVQRKILYDTCKLFHSMVKLGAVANIIGALLYVIAIYNTTSPNLILTWYGLLFLCNIANVYWATLFGNKNITLRALLKCRKGLLFNLIIISLLWGCTSILFMTDGYQQQITTLIFLSAVLICFTFSTATDLVMGIISIICIVLPTVIYHIYLAIHQHALNQPIQFALSITTAFFIMGGFMLIANGVANRVIIKMLKLSYENVLLRQKLENINFSLERNVKKRTQELNDSLNLVSYQSTHDLLTELPNERSLNEHVEKAIARASRNHHQFALACLSINGMEKIIDGLGYQTASTIIKRVAQRLSLHINNSNKYFISLSRQDIFTISIEGVMDIEHSLREFLHVLNEPFYIADQALKLTGSVGVCVYPNDGQDLDTLITNAESARMLALKHGGNSIRIYHTVINADAYRRLHIENALYYALENNELLLHYQPFVDLLSETVNGAEALIRWKNPQLGMVSPLEFISIAEANGMIQPIGAWVLDAACQQLKKLHILGFKNFIMSVNLSAKQLAQKNLVEQVSKILHHHQIDGQFLKLELTESGAFQREAIPVVQKLTDMGIKLAIDDFGTGYSDFTHFKLFKINQIKIDRTFIQDLDVNMDSRHIVCNTIALASRLKINCLAEGVENIEQLKFLKENGCHSIQGYYFSKPLNESDFEKFMVSTRKFGLKDKL